MNPYDIASGRIEVDKPLDADKVEAEQLMLEQKGIWLNHPITRELIAHLKQNEADLAFGARDFIADTFVVNKLLIKSKTYKEILDYVTGRD